MSAASAAVFGLDPFWLSLALLLATYAILTVDRLNRAIVALVGAGLMMLTGILDQGGAVAGQDFNTLALLIGMMLLVAIARPSGMFQYLAFWAAKSARGHPGYLLALLAATGDWVMVGSLAVIVALVSLGQLAAWKGWLQ